MRTKTKKPDDEQDEVKRVDPKERTEQSVIVEAKRLHAMAFSKEQIARQLSAKFTLLVDDVTDILDRSDYAGGKAKK